MTDREAIDVLFNEWKCIDRNDGIHCDRKCESCDLVILTQKALDTISRQDAIRWVKTECNPYGKPTIDFESGKRVIEHLKRMSSAHPIQPNTSNTLKSLDCIDRKAAIDALKKNRSIYCDNTPESFRCLPHDEKSRVDEIDACIAELVNLPSAQPEPLSDAYMKSVWTWLLDYQIKVAKLKGRYTPYEVLSWVANDWRKEHEGSD